MKLSPRLVPVAVLVVLAASCGGGTKRFTARGSLSLSDGLTFENPDGTCDIHEAGWDDIRPGAAVTVTAPGGAMFAGQLRQGRHDGERCVFAFEVPEVPVHDGQYTVEVTHRGKVVYDRADLEAGVTLAPT